MPSTQSAAAPRPLSGPAFGPKDGGTPRWLMVLLHGVGADGSDLISLAPLFAEMAPGLKLLSPHAPEPCDMAPFGRQWFSLMNRDPMAMYAGLTRVAPDVDAFLDEQLAAAGLDDDHLILGGFSQGAMTALHVGLRRKKSPAGILAFSGALVGRNRLADEMTCHPPVLIVHGEDDDIVPCASARDAERTLLGDGIDVMAHVLPGLGHGIDQRGLALAQKFLQRLGVAA